MQKCCLIPWHVLGLAVSIPPELHLCTRRTSSSLHDSELVKENFVMQISHSLVPGMAGGQKSLFVRLKCACSIYLEVCFYKHLVLNSDSFIPTSNKTPKVRARAKWHWDKFRWRASLCEGWGDAWNKKYLFGFFFNFFFKSVECLYNAMFMEKVWCCVHSWFLHKPVVFDLWMDLGTKSMLTVQQGDCTEDFLYI